MWMFQLQQDNGNLQCAAVNHMNWLGITNINWEMRTDFQDSEKYNTYIKKPVLPAMIRTTLRSITIKETEK